MLKGLSDEALTKEIMFAEGFNFPADDGPAKEWLNALLMEQARRSADSILLTLFG